MKAQQLKDKAAAAFGSGKFAKAAELYAEYCKQEARDLQARIRMGDAFARSGKTDQAISAYQSAAEEFAREGFLPRAIAASKLVLDLDPSHKEVQRMLAALYARKSTGATAKRAEGESASAFPAVETAGEMRVQRTAADFDLAWEPRLRKRVPKVPLFSDLPEEAFIELFERGPILRFKRGERVFEQGSAGEAFYVVCQGEVKIRREQGGRIRQLAMLGEGAFFGEMALLSHRPRTASVESTSDQTELLEISAKLLADLSRRYPWVAEALKKFCRQRLLSNVMEASALFSPFDPQERLVLVEKFLAKEVPPGAVIIREGEEADGLYVILSGEVRVEKASRRLAQLKEGDIFGEMSLLTKSPATATVLAVRRSSLLRLPREDFDELIMSHPQILVLVSELTEDRKRQTHALLQKPAAGKQRTLLV
jgi:CRP-like cAMP-binding protein